MKSHQDFIFDEIARELTTLFTTFDTRTLASAMLIRSAKALRALHSTGMWKKEDVRVVVEAALKDIYEPLPKDQLPPVSMIGQPKGPLQ
jgi:hypothetical protein